jgi:pimeloyl-ACP methyl ester carboxylesterase
MSGSDPGPTPTRPVTFLSETDFTEDLEKFDVPTLILHGEDDQIVPAAPQRKDSP